MKILQIVSSSRTSGAEKHVVVLSERLRSRGHEVMALCPPGGWLPGQLRAAEIPTIESVMHGPRSVSTVLSLIRIVRENNIDLIHSHLTRATYFGILAGRLANLPLVSSVHVITHDLAYRRFFPGKSNQIITVSDFLRGGMLKQGIPESMVRTIYNGTDFCMDAPGMENVNEESAVLDRYSLHQDGVDAETLPVRAELSLPPEAELVGLFAHVGDFKGHPILVRSMRQIVAARPHVYFVCVGAVEPQMQRTLWEMAAADGLAERLRFTGVRNDVQRLMAEMDVMTLPSQYESCSMSIIEAMAMGKPVVATRAGGNPELVQDNETGLLIERTPEALAAALIHILADKDRRREMGEAARRRAATQFSARVMTENIEALYMELVKGKSVGIA